MSNQELDHIAERLSQPDATNHDVINYLRAQARLLDNPPFIFEFYSGEVDFEAYQAISRAWPRSKKLPIALRQPPSIFILCWHYEQGPSFAARLDRYCNQVNEYMPLGWQSKQKGDPRAKEAYRIYLELCTKRKAAYDAITPQVTEAYKAWQRIRDRTA